MINGTLSKFATHDNSAYPGLWRGCVGAWCPSLGPSGSRLHDYSRGQAWATIANATFATCWEVDSSRYALRFGLDDNYLDMGNPQYFNQGVFCLSVWVNFTSASTIVIFAKSVAGAAVNRWWLTGSEYSAGTIAFRTGNTTGDQGTVSAGGYNDGKWHHVFAVHRAGSVSLYIDNALTTGTPLQGPANTNYALMMARYNNSTGGVPGSGTASMKVDDIRFYTRDVSPSEIRILATRRGIAFTPRTRRLAAIEQAAGGTQYTLTISEAVTNLTGQSVSLKFSRALNAANATVSFSGQSTSLNLSRTLQVAKADIGLSAQQANLNVSRTLVVDNATINLSGQTSTLSAGKVLAVGNGQVQLQGQLINLAVQRKLSVGNASVELAGQTISIGFLRTLGIADGVIQVQGQTADLKSAKNLGVSPGTINVSGQTVALKVLRSLSVSHATIQAQGEQVTLRLSKSLTVLPATVQTTGQSTQLLVARKLTVQNGSVDLDGQDTIVYRRYDLGIGHGSVSFSGESQGLLTSRKIAVTRGLVQLSGQSVQMYPTFQNPVQTFGGNLRFIDKTTGSLKFIQEITR